MPDINEICKIAWDATKKEQQPVYDTLDQGYKEMLINRAGVVIGAGGAVEPGPFAVFDAHVFGQSVLPDDVKEELVEEITTEVPPQAMAVAMPIPEEEPKPEPEPVKPKRPRKKAAPKAVKKKPRPVKVVKKSMQKGAKKR